ncbi:unnamed protein product [Dovyalis caffra]|uniref:Histidine-containing phosphotransfer protein n=1 Tax=Dovyalis caffra TaxID=77055 RepID=A0AAV1SK56_9ROSI|nr:unnamed protein product [Dovyalis caffra]
MDREQLQHQAAYMRRSLFDQGYLDDQFVQLEDLQDEANPNFVDEVVTLFYTDSVRLIQNIEQAMINKHNIDFGKLDDYMHQFKGSSSSIGAKKMRQDFSTTQARACHFEEETRNSLSGLRVSVKCKYKLIPMATTLLAKALSFYNDKQRETTSLPCPDWPPTWIEERRSRDNLPRSRTVKVLSHNINSIPLLILQ